MILTVARLKKVVSLFPDSSVSLTRGGCAKPEGLSLRTNTNRGCRCQVLFFAPNIAGGGGPHQRIAFSGPTSNAMGASS